MRKKGAEHGRSAQGPGAAHDLAIEFLDSLDSRPVWPRAGYEQMRDALGRPLPRAPSDPVDVLTGSRERPTQGWPAFPAAGSSGSSSAVSCPPRSVPTGSRVSGTRTQVSTR